MKKQILGIIWLALWLLISGSSFAQETEYPLCSQASNWIFSCQEKEICNNPGSVCRCKVAASPFTYATEHYIPHNTSCLANTEFVKKKIISSYVISGSIVTFEFTVQNNATAKTFELRLPTAWQNPRINITNISVNDDDWRCNWWSIKLANWFLNPSCYIYADKRATITITGEIVSSSFIFSQIETNTCLKNIGSNICIDSERTTTSIFPTTNYSISQRILDPKPIFWREQAIYEIEIQNNGSKVSNQSVAFTSILGNFLGEPIFSLQKAAILAPYTRNKTHVWDLGIFSPGESKTYTLTTPLLSTPPAGSIIITTGSINAGSEIILADNVVVTSYTIPTFIDLQIEKIEKTSEEPEANQNELGYTIRYKNKGNTTINNLQLTALISWTNLSVISSWLASLDAETMNFVNITWTVNQDYPIWTRFCLSWNIIASNETESTDNNSFSGNCYTFVKSADVAIEAELLNEIVSIKSWSKLNYAIKLSNKGEKTAKNIGVKLFPSANQSSETAVDLTGITLAGGEEKTITYSAILRSYPIQGTSISLSGELSFTGIDLDATNNSFDIKYDLPALSDVYIKHSMLPFSWFKQGDTVTYIINYGNSWYASAWNPIVRLTLPSSISASETEWNLGKSLPAGNTGTIIVTWTLKEFLAAWTEFSSEARIFTDSAQVTTGNDVSVITWTVAAHNNISFWLSAQNTTRPDLTINPTSLVRAVSGDIITFTLTYTNNGNVPQNVGILFTNIWSLVLDSYNWNLGTIWVNQQGTITISGRIVGKGFSPFTPTATISYNNTSVAYSITIEEPYQCWDGLLTQNEVCDTALNINYWTWLACENQWGTCVLVTKFISNTACIQTLDWIDVCSNQAIINLNEPKCKTLEVRKPSANSSSINAICFGQYTSAYTLIGIDCGNGTVFTGFAGTLQQFPRTCTYNSSQQADSAIVSCRVGNDINNPNCRTRIPSCEIDLDTNVVILEDDDEWSVWVECSTNNWLEATLEIDCGNGNRKSGNGSAFSHKCTYDKDDLDWDSSAILDIQCKVDGILSCEDELILDQWIMGICGDGIRQGYEQCDLEENRDRISYHLDTRNRFDAPSSARGKMCYNCSIEDQAPAQCLSVHNGNISIEKGEYLPAWWRVNQNSFTSATSTNCSNSINDGKIIMSTMKCTFELQKPGGQKKTLLTRDCISNPDENRYPIFNYFKQYMSAFAWKYAFWPELFNTWVGNDLGEYKLRLNEITYDYCDDWERKTSKTDNVCETNFTITKPYLVQKSAFGMTPKTSTINLDDFYDINKKSYSNKNRSCKHYGS
jgi:uncharacterized repeat protein (TIGR01451 family)